MISVLYFYSFFIRCSVQCCKSVFMMKLLGNTRVGELGICVENLKDDVTVNVYIEFKCFWRVLLVIAVVVECEKLPRFYKVVKLISFYRFSASQNGGYVENVEEESKVDDSEQPNTHPEVSRQVVKEDPESCNEQPADDNQQIGDVEPKEEKSTQVNDPSKGDIQELEVENSVQVNEPSKGNISAELPGDIQEGPPAEPPEMEGVQFDQEHPAADDQTITRKMEVPNNKVMKRFVENKTNFVLLVMTEFNI